MVGGRSLPITQPLRTHTLTGHISRCGGHRTHPQHMSVNISPIFPISPITPVPPGISKPSILLVPGFNQVSRKAIERI
jgi:hypothetical protein